jgi:hypothetical protein
MDQSGRLNHDSSGPVWFYEQYFVSRQNIAPEIQILYAIWEPDLSHSGRVSGIPQQSALIFALHFTGNLFKTD